KSPEPKGPERYRMRPAGWHAFNIARIEAGSPLFYVDFGPGNLPHESGVLKDRVSFTKGCYLGQEVVARMQSLGHPKQLLVGLRITKPIEKDSQQPVTGDRVFASDEAGAEAVGAVTSSTIAPLLSQSAICFAQVKWANATADKPLFIDAAGDRLPAVIKSLDTIHHRAVGW
ncbi:MAG: tRNA-modifying protein YgfZ, partial [Planctomycetota bacterium]|nr:tRNA-modifying protein YgfZ [Planctomycetota bacterium]